MHKSIFVDNGYQCKGTRKFQIQCNGLVIFEMTLKIPFLKVIHTTTPILYWKWRNMTRDIITLYESEKIKLYSKLKSLDCWISFYNDLWISIQNKGYCSLTIYFIKSNWKIMRTILNFFDFKDPILPIQKQILFWKSYSIGMFIRIWCVFLSTISRQMTKKSED